MSVEKVPNMAAHGAGNTKSGVGVKGGLGAQGAGEASDPEGVFGALLSSLGVDDAESTVAMSAVPQAPDDQPMGNVSTDGNALMAFAPLVQVSALTVAVAGIDGNAVGGGQDTSRAEGRTPSAGGVGLTAADTLFSGAAPGTKVGFRSAGQSDLSQIQDEIAPANFGAKAIRSAKERARNESTVAATILPTQSANGADASRFDIRAVGDKVEFLGRAMIAPAAVDIIPSEVGQQTEFRRDKAIFKVNSTTAVADWSATNGPDVKPGNLSLGGMAPDGGAGMAQSDQNPGTYWMTSDMKNAEMKLDVFGESPVEVSISVHGNQTHVAFRTDEAQTRLALEDAGTTLKDMLSKEGLNLAGLSVGTSGTGGEGTQDPRSRQESSPALIGQLVSKFPSETSAHFVARRVGQLDVFV